MGVSFIFLEVLVLRRTISKISELLSLIGILLTHIVGLFKLGILTFGRNKIKKLMDVLQDPKYQYEPIDNFKPDRVFLKEKKINSVICITVNHFY